ncbi:MAG TPA: hypothetical protein P5205_02005 [Candidatus Paceibacterota bacterium]|nr:hypothetical protein [Verrucomicrobiota bacterium]HSA09120.1 hypothetical protein [Candidatus Paceibacterota bacterium]
MKSHLHLALIVGAWFVVSCPAEGRAGPFGPKGSTAAEKKASIRQQRDEMLGQLRAANPRLQGTLSQAAGYATFKQVSLNLLLLASANGYGMVVDNQTGKETFMRVASLGGGVGAGVKDLRVIFIFHNPAVMKQFVEQGVQFGGQADASAKYQDTGISGEQSVKAGVNYKEGTVAAGSSTDLTAKAGGHGSAGTALATRGGMEIYQFTESGVSLQATVSGTKYWKDSKLNK